MEKLLNLAAQKADQAELAFTEDTSDSVEFTDGKLDKADSSLSSVMALRIIKNGRVGFAHTRNLLDEDTLVKQALLSAENGMEVGFSFPHTTNVTEVKSYDAGITALSKKDLIEEGKELIDYIKSRSDGQVNFNISYGTGKYGIMNSAGTNLGKEYSFYSAVAFMLFPGSGSGVFTYRVNKGHEAIPQAELDYILHLYKLSQNTIVPETRKMPVIFYPTSAINLFSRIEAAINPANIYSGTSPLCGRTGEKIFSDKLTIRQDPFAPDMVGSSGFDMEGIPRQQNVFFDKGVFKMIPTDLNYAHKLGLAPNGNGSRSSMEGMPGADAANICIDPGNKTLKEMIAGIKEGLIVQSLMGAHSGNILNGDYSVGVGTGFYILNGELIGRVKDCLLSGNIYENLMQIEAIESSALNLGSIKMPSLLINDVSVAGK